MLIPGMRGRLFQMPTMTRDPGHVASLLLAWVGFVLFLCRWFSP